MCGSKKRDHDERLTLELDAVTSKSDVVGAPANTGPPVDMAAQKKQWKSSLAKFTRLLWSMDWETSLKELAKDSNATQTFARWMQTEAVGDASSVEALAAISSVKGKPNAAGEAMR